MNKLIQHYRNGRNWGDSYYFITKMMLCGHLLTDQAYKLHIESIVSKLDDSTNWLSHDEVDKWLKQYGIGEIK